jgi:hypothetical protein
MMVHTSFQASETVLQQGAMPKERDCMYVLESGEAEVLISGAVQSGKKSDEENKQVRVRGPCREPAGLWVCWPVGLLRCESARCESASFQPVSLRASSL